MKIEILNTTYFEKYDSLSAELGSVFNNRTLLAVYGSNLTIYGIHQNDGQLIGGFHLYKSTTSGFSHIKNPPFIPHIGLFIKNKSSNQASRLTFEKNCIRTICDFISNLHASIYTFSLPENFIDSQPFFWSKYKVVPNYTYHINLKNSEESIISSYSTEKRNELKKSEKEGIVVKQITDYSIVKKLVAKTFERKKENLPSEILDKILLQFATNENSFAFAAYKEETIVAICFCLTDSANAYYLLGGYDADSKQGSAGTSLIHAAIQHSKKLEKKIFDFEGSMITEVESFFRGFGGELKPYNTINKASLLLELGLKFIKRTSF
ncbi:MAG: GNAT family N-acetyltransferase [Bacteroidetes bacterium]|nr:GNAT family N-acetyltransferase [Bacteroidota bacterium]